MKVGLTRIVTICLINFLLNYLLLFPLGLFKYIETQDLSMFALIGIVVSAIPAVATLMFYKFIDKRPISTLGFKMKKADVVFSVLSVTITVALYFVYILISSHVGVVSAEWNVAAFSKGSFYFLLFLTFISWFIAAFYEEVLFRGYFAANLKFLSPAKLYIVTSIIFMVFHIFRGFPLIDNVILMGMSCVFLYIYLKSGSLLPCIFAHLIFNLTSTHLVGTSDIAILQYTGNPGILNLIIIITYAVAQIILAKAIYQNKYPEINFAKLTT
ncbi:lysostaphin resistance A-like protein [Neobacillus sp. NPDC093127]|uniref:CPBP family intramembrane glutamic endopeptidase n=1 Tax=Neobacillus sp. NPDC093127 TaxID=3364296 RepID=UPI003815F94D